MHFNCAETYSLSLSLSLSTCCAFQPYGNVVAFFGGNNMPNFVTIARILLGPFFAVTRVVPAFGSVNMPKFMAKTEGFVVFFL